MKTLLVKKKNGKIRKVYSPRLSVKKQIKSHLPELNRRALHLCDLDIVHGFLPGRSPVTNAEKHIGYRYTLSMDIEDFFDSINLSHLNTVLTDKEQKELLYNGVPVQGLPTSPVISNLAMIEFDKMVKHYLSFRGIVYTRYADDLTFSFNAISQKEIIISVIKYVCAKYRLTVNKSKTRFQTASFGRRSITGVSVGENDIQVSRKLKRRMRAAKYNNNYPEYMGLLEWSKLKKPKENVDFELDRKRLREYYGIKKLIKDSDLIF